MSLLLLFTEGIFQSRMQGTPEGYRRVYQSAKREAALEDSPFYGRQNAAFYFHLCKQQDLFMSRIETVVRSIQPLLHKHEWEELTEVHQSLTDLLAVVLQITVMPDDIPAGNMSK